MPGAYYTRCCFSYLLFICLIQKKSMPDIVRAGCGLQFHANDAIKVVHTTNDTDINAWYLDGTDNDFTIGQDGVYTIYFDPNRPDEQSQWNNGWYAGYFYVVRTGDLTYVAQIGNTKYESLKDALDVAGANDTIELLADCTVDETYLVTKNITIDGNGFTIKATAAVEVFKFDTLTAKLTVSNCKFDGDNVGLRAATTQGAKGSNNPNAVINFTNVTVKNFVADNYAGAVYVFGTSKGNFTNCTITGNAVPAAQADFAYAGADIWAGAAATVTIDGGTYGEVFINANSSNGSKVIVDGDATVAELVLEHDRGDANAELKDANITTLQLNEGYAGRATVTDDTVFTVPEGYMVVDNAIVPAEFFVGKSLTLEGDIAVNFFIKRSTLEALEGSENAYVKFTLDGKTINAQIKVYDRNPTLKYASIDVVAAQMAHIIDAKLYIGNDVIDETTYSVQEYGEETIRRCNSDKYDHEELYTPALKKLVTEMLNYGSYAQTVFRSTLNEKPDHLANANINYDATEMNAVDANTIKEAIKAANNQQVGDDLSEIAAEFGANYATSSVVFLSKNTLRHYFTKADDSFNANNFNGVKSGRYYVEKVDIPAAQLDTLQTFTVGDVTFNYSVLDYAMAVLNGNANQNAKNLVKALYLYNQAANAYFE